MDRQAISPSTPQGEVESSNVRDENLGTTELDMLAKAHEFFQICDIEGKGFVFRHEMQRLHGELPLSPQELENVFDTLDADGNGSLTLEEFTTGFSQFLFGQKKSISELQWCETENVHQPNWEESNLEGDEEDQFSNLLESLGSSTILEDESTIKKLWLHLRKDEPHLLSSFEEFLAKVLSQLQEANYEKEALENALQKKITDYDEEIKNLYEEMEQQIKNEKQSFLLKDTERFQSRSQDLERKLTAKEQELEQLAQKQKRLEGQCRELHHDKIDTKVENTKLKLTNQELQNELEITSQALIVAQQQLQILQEEAKKLQEEKEVEVYRVTETLQREKSGLLKQLDFLRERNKYLRDERDMCLYQKSEHVPPAALKQRSGSIIGNYLEGKGSLKSRTSEDDDTFSTSRRRNSYGLNECPTVDSESTAAGGLIRKKCLQRIISIEEDHLPQLLDRSEKQLTKWSEEDEDALPDMEINGTQIKSPSEQTPSSPREQPVGKETLSNDEQVLGPDRLFKIVFVGNSSVGKTSFLRRFSEDHFYSGTAATVGVDYSVKTVIVDNSRIVLQLWDTAGQERYRSITKQFFRKADGVVVMYDITARDTFQDVKQWLVSIEEAAGENIPVLLLGNKIDNEKEREVPHALGDHLAKEYKLIFYECSALSGDNTNKSLLHLTRVLKEQEDKVKEQTIQLHQSSKKKACCSRL
uniref:EF-hand calcium-binding domain-containing protein 4B n=1 Tax=Pogona vitticeps TaxID=103695 RepID=A0A6J0UZZ1_9SAUR